MPLTFGEKIKIIMGRRRITISDFAKKIGQSPQNMSNKMNRDNFSEKELKEIATALDCTFETVFKMNDTGEEI
ncbi:MAG: helix-turn-helix transcriptional regulator [Treponema sp.]|jgi:transcriptional regulator with XRE-family HTH domain|nr:helix-turn-helix transcriptional regulator [Treponema sp.]